MVAIVPATQVNSCRKGSAVKGPTPLSFVTPKGFPPPVYDFAGNPPTKEGFELGRKLFYDGILSRDGNFPCASCHQQFAAFCTYDHDFSHGFDNQFSTRNAPGLFNMAWQKEFMWDGGVNHLEVQALAPLTAHNEMAEDIGHVVEKLKADNTYRMMFKAAFGEDDINSQKMLKALAQFVVMLVSADSKYDRVKQGRAVFTAAEESGYAIFRTKCAHCHTEPLFTDFSYRNTGLPIHPTLKDMGRMRISGNPADSLRFKVPSLRNVMLTFPYMHDARFYSLDQVLRHYSSAIVKSPSLDTSLANGIALSQADKNNIKAFLRTLTDSAFISNKRFAQP
ncbi:MAG: cytochrome-c peroxidase [Bacteroidetes bacterium]|nr:cytochrome-c peroxidase [Bacteroidota bacterium]